MSIKDTLAYSPHQLTEILPLGRVACYELARKIGKRVGRKLVVSRAELERWLAQQESATLTSTSENTAG